MDVVLTQDGTLGRMNALVSFDISFYSSKKKHIMLSLLRLYQHLYKKENSYMQLFVLLHARKLKGCTVTAFICLFSY